MFRHKATTVVEYLASLPPERRGVVAAMREFVRKHIPAGYEEGINWGAITWSVPLARYPNTYNGQPLCYVALAAQKNYNALYLMTVYGDSQLAADFKARFKRAGKRLDMGKSCVRFKSTEDLALEAVQTALGVASPEQWIAHYESVRDTQAAKKKQKKTRKAVRKKPASRSPRSASLRR
jgi:hypothetical protein